MIHEWTGTMYLLTPYGTLPFNGPVVEGGGPRYLLDRGGCDMWQDLRGTDKDLPQADGGQIFERFDGRTQLKLKMLLLDGEEPACGTVLREMVDNVTLHLAQLSKASMAGRFFWIPDGIGDYRLLDFVRRASRMQWDWPQSPNPVTCTVLLDSPFPYSIDYTQIATTIGDGASATLTNTGSVPMWPVFKVYGPSTAFVLSNDTTGLLISWDSALPDATPLGGGDYVEIDTFRGTAYLNGSGANEKTGIVVSTTDFWPLVPGPNVVSLSGADHVQVLWQGAGA